MDERVVSTSVFSVRSFDIDAYGYLNPARMAGYLQQAASESADALGFGLSALNTRGLTWVLIRQQWEISQAIMLGDEITIETWPSGVDRRAALRDFRICKMGAEIGRVITSWFVLEIANRRPVRPAVVLGPSFPQRLPHVLEPPNEGIAGLVDFTSERQFDVRYSDIDINHHVTNASYVDWALEAVDTMTWSQRHLVGLDVQFMAECRLGSSVISRAAQQRHGQWLHSIVRKDDQKELARAVSIWVAK